jgi:hypothetical protein
MQAKGGAVAFVLAVALAVAGCGATDWNAAATKSKAASQAAAKAAAAAAARAERPYVEALVASQRANDGSTTAAAAADDRCVAVAIVHGYGAQVLVNHGLTPNGLRNPDTTLDVLPAPTVAQVDAVGAGLQRCHIDIFGRSLAEGLGVTDAAGVACFVRSMTLPAARRFLVLMLLSRPIDLAAAHNVVGLIAGCMDLATLVVRGIDPSVDAETRTCVANAMHGADAELKDYLALEMSKSDPAQLQVAKDALGVAINQCRPGAQTGFTVPPS